MKLFLASLVLGCAASSVRPALQSNVFSINKINRSNLSNPPRALDFAVVLDRIGLHFSTTVYASPLPHPPKPRKLNPEEALKLIKACAKKHRVPQTFVRSIVEAESNYDSEAVSPAGAIGLMQLM